MTKLNKVKKPVSPVQPFKAPPPRFKKRSEGMVSRWVTAAARPVAVVFILQLATVQGYNVTAPSSCSCMPLGSEGRRSGGIRAALENLPFVRSILCLRECPGSRSGGADAATLRALGDAIMANSVATTQVVRAMQSMNNWTASNVRALWTRMSQVVRDVSRIQREADLAGISNGFLLHAMQQRIGNVALSVDQRRILGALLGTPDGQAFLTFWTWSPLTGRRSLPFRDMNHSVLDVWSSFEAGSYPAVLGTLNSAHTSLCPPDTASSFYVNATWCPYVTISRMPSLWSVGDYGDTSQDVIRVKDFSCGPATVRVPSCGETVTDSRATLMGLWAGTYEFQQVVGQPNARRSGPAPPTPPGLVSPTPSPTALSVTSAPTPLLGEESLDGLPIGEGAFLVNGDLYGDYLAYNFSSPAEEWTLSEEESLVFNSRPVPHYPSSNCSDVWVNFSWDGRELTADGYEGCTDAVLRFVDGSRLLGGWSAGCNGTCAIGMIESNRSISSPGLPYAHAYYPIYRGNSLSLSVEEIEMEMERSLASLEIARNETATAATLAEIASQSALKAQALANKAQDSSTVGLILTIVGAFVGLVVMVATCVCMARMGRRSAFAALPMVAAAPADAFNTYEQALRDTIFAGATIGVTLSGMVAVVLIVSVMWNLWFTYFPCCTKRSTKRIGALLLATWVAAVVGSMLAHWYAFPQGTRVVVIAWNFIALIVIMSLPIWIWSVCKKSPSERSDEFLLEVVQEKKDSSGFEKLWEEFVEAISKVDLRYGTTPMPIIRRGEGMYCHKVRTITASTSSQFIHEAAHCVICTHHPEVDEYMQENPANALADFYAVPSAKRIGKFQTHLAQAISLKTPAMKLGGMFVHYSSPSSLNDSEVRALAALTSSKKRKRSSTVQWRQEVREAILANIRNWGHELHASVSAGALGWVNEIKEEDFSSAREVKPNVAAATIIYMTGVKVGHKVDQRWWSKRRDRGEGKILFVSNPAISRYYQSLLHVHPRPCPKEWEIASRVSSTLFQPIQQIWDRFLERVLPLCPEAEFHLPPSFELGSPNRYFPKRRVAVVDSIEGMVHEAAHSLVCDHWGGSDYLHEKVVDEILKFPPSTEEWKEQVFSALRDCHDRQEEPCREQGEVVHFMDPSPLFERNSWDARARTLCGSLTYAAPEVMKEAIISSLSAGSEKDSDSLREALKRALGMSEELFLSVIGVPSRLRREDEKDLVSPSPAMSDLGRKMTMVTIEDEEEVATTVQVPISYPRWRADGEFFASAEEEDAWTEEFGPEIPPHSSSSPTWRRSQTPPLLARRGRRGGLRRVESSRVTALPAERGEYPKDLFPGMRIKPSRLLLPPHSFQGEKPALMIHPKEGTGLKGVLDCQRVAEKIRHRSWKQDAGDGRAGLIHLQMFNDALNRAGLPRLPRATPETYEYERSPNGSCMPGKICGDYRVIRHELLHLFVEVMWPDVTSLEGEALVRVMERSSEPEWHEVFFQNRSRMMMNRPDGQMVVPCRLWHNQIYELVEVEDELRLVVDDPSHPALFKWHSPGFVQSGSTIYRVASFGEAKENDKSNNNQMLVLKYGLEAWWPAPGASLPPTPLLSSDGLNPKRKEEEDEEEEEDPNQSGDGEAEGDEEDEDEEFFPPKSGNDGGEAPLHPSSQPPVSLLTASQFHSAVTAMSKKLETIVEAKPSPAVLPEKVAVKVAGTGGLHSKGLDAQTKKKAVQEQVKNSNSSSALPTPGSISHYMNPIPLGGKGGSGSGRGQSTVRGGMGRTPHGRSQHSQSETEGSDGGSVQSESLQSRLRFLESRIEKASRDSQRITQLEQQVQSLSQTVSDLRGQLMKCLDICGLGTRCPACQFDLSKKEFQGFKCCPGCGTLLKGMYQGVPQFPPQPASAWGPPGGGGGGARGGGVGGGVGMEMGRDEVGRHVSFPAAPLPSPSFSSSSSSSSSSSPPFHMAENRSAEGSFHPPASVPALPDMTPMSGPPRNFNVPKAKAIATGIAGPTGARQPAKLYALLPMGGLNRWAMLTSQARAEIRKIMDGFRKPTLVSAVCAAISGVSSPSRPADVLNSWKQSIGGDLMFDGKGNDRTVTMKGSSIELAVIGGVVDPRMEPDIRSSRAAIIKAMTEAGQQDWVSVYESMVNEGAPTGVKASEKKKRTQKREERKQVPDPNSKTQKKKQFAQESGLPGKWGNLSDDAKMSFTAPHMDYIISCLTNHWQTSAALKASARAEAVRTGRSFDWPAVVPWILDQWADQSANGAVLDGKGNPFRLLRKPEAGYSWYRLLLPGETGEPAGGS